MSRIKYPSPMWSSARRAPAPRAWAAFHAVWLAASALLIAVGMAGAALAQVQQPREAHVVEVNGIISPITDRYITRALEEADRSGAEAVVITLDTPGGLLSATRDITEALLSAPVPVVVYVSPQGAHAASAGTFITAAAHVAAMAPGTNIGAASPVGGQGEDLDETIKDKVFEDTAAQIRAIAETRGRPSEPLEATVLEAKSYTAEEALELGVVDVIAVSVNDLLKQADGRTVVIITADGERSVTLHTADAPVRNIRMGLFDRILSYIADPNVAFLLISLGGLGLFVEFWNPGLIFPGVAGLVALVLGLAALGSLPGNWAGAALILLAFVLFSIEFNVDGFGLFGALGVASIVLGGVLLFSHFGTPSPVLPDISVSPWAIAPVAGVMGLAVLLLAREVGRARRAQRGQPVPDPILVGMTGMVSAALAPEGKVRVRGETWNARSTDGSHIARGASVVVRTEQGALLEVERTETTQAEGTQET